MQYQQPTSANPPVLDLWAIFYKMTPQSIEMQTAIAAPTLEAAIDQLNEIFKDETDSVIITGSGKYHPV